SCASHLSGRLPSAILHWPAASRAEEDEDMSATTHVRHRGRACAIAATARLVLPAALAMIAGCGALPSYEEVRSSVPADELVEIDGQWVHYERAGAGTPVILLHGFGESTYSWRHVLPVLAESFD